MAVGQNDYQLFGKIPVANVFLLQLYASKFYRTLRQDRRASIDENPDGLFELLAEVLIGAVKRRLLRQLTQSYDEQRDRLRRVRGRIDHLTTARQRLMLRGLIACKFDKLNSNTPENRYVRSALTKLANLLRSSGGENETSATCSELATRMHFLGVGDESVSWHQVATSGGRVAHYFDSVMLSAARFVHEIAIPHERSGQYKALPIEITEREMRKLFEAAVRGLYDVVLRNEGWHVRGNTKHEWRLSDSSGKFVDYMPSMEFDIVLNNPELHKRMIIDTKFTSVFDADKRFIYNEKEARLRFKSGYIYQLYAYVRSQERQEDPLSLRAEGMLLHPAIDINVSEWGEIQNHRFRLETVDLTMNARDIRDRLVEIVAKVSEQDF